MPTTNENLNHAFSGESQASMRYKIFADKAEAEGYENVAKLFRLTSEAERIHATGHMKALDAISSTIENLEASINGETDEYSNMYPPMYEQAKAENSPAKRMFGFALSVEEVHAQLYTKALEAVKAGVDLDVSDIYLCPICGYIELGEAPEKCPVCGCPNVKFITISK